MTSPKFKFINHSTSPPKDLIAPPAISLIRVQGRLVRRRSDVAGTPGAGGGLIAQRTLVAAKRHLIAALLVLIPLLSFMTTAGIVIGFERVRSALRCRRLDSLRQANDHRACENKD